MNAGKVPPVTVRRALSEHPGDNAQGSREG
jgi:hypothetical protein